MSTRIEKSNNIIQYIVVIIPNKYNDSEVNCIIFVVDKTKKKSSKNIRGSYTQHKRKTV